MTDHSSPNPTPKSTTMLAPTTTQQAYDPNTALWPLVRVLADMAQRVALEQVRQLAELGREEAP